MRNKLFGRLVTEEAPHNEHRADPSGFRPFRLSARQREERMEVKSPSISNATAHIPGHMTPMTFDPLVMRACVWSGIILVAMTVVGLGWFMGYAPPPRADWTAHQSLEFVKTNQTSILFGAAICTFFWSFWATWAAPIILCIRHMERSPLLTIASVVGVGGGAGVITTIAVSWTVMAFRAESPQIVQAFNDLGFFLFLYTWPPFAIWMVIIAVAILRDINARPLFPRWVAYYNLLCAIGMAPASLMGFFKTGPFAFHGRLAFWLVALDFFVWLLVMSWVMLGVISREQELMPSSKSR